MYPLTGAIRLKAIGSPDLMDFPRYVNGVAGTAVHSRENLFEILGTPVTNCLKVTGNPVKSCLKYWQP